MSNLNESGHRAPTVLGRGLRKSLSRSRSPVRQVKGGSDVILFRASQQKPSTPNRREDDEIRFGPGGYDFTSPEPLPTKAKDRLNELVMSGQLFRYQGGADDVAKLEKEFSRFIGLPHTMACNSGGCGLFLALKALGVKPGEPVMVNAWTLAPVPGAVVHANAKPIFVKTSPGTLAIDIEDVERKAKDTGAKILLVSYMRGHVPNMDALMEVVKRLGLKVIEDCAHTMGATWKLDDEDHHRHLGTFGDVGVWSLQTNKTLNCGEGGLISTANQDLASFITVATGSYGHFGMNGASGDVNHTSKVYTSVPNMSMRMTTVAAALALPQLEAVQEKLDRWLQHAVILRDALEACEHTRLVKHRSYTQGKEYLVWSSIQFELVGFTEDMVETVIATLANMGIPLAWFGGPTKGFTSTLRDWKFADPKSEQWNDCHAGTIRSLVDVPLYHTASWSDAVFHKLAKTLIATICEVKAAAAAAEHSPHAVLASRANDMRLQASLLV